MSQSKGWRGFLGLAFAAAAVLGILGMPGPGRAADLKIGFVDLDRALNECAVGKKAVESLKKKKERYESEGKKMQEELSRMKEDYDKQSLTLNDEARRQKERDMRDRERDLQNFVRDKQEEITDERNRKMQLILKDLKKVIRDLGQAGSYTLVLEKAQLDDSIPSIIPPVILYAQGGDDLTTEAISRYDKLAPGEKGDDAAGASSEGKENKEEKGGKKPEAK